MAKKKAKKKAKAAASKPYKPKPLKDAEWDALEREMIKAFRGGPAPVPDDTERAALAKAYPPQKPPSDG